MSVVVFWIMMAVYFGAVPALIVLFAMKTKAIGSRRVRLGLGIAAAALYVAFLGNFVGSWPDPGRTPCFSNVRHIGLALVQYRDEHGGTYPQSLGVLLHGGYLPHLLFLQCPSGGRRLPEALPEDFTSASIESLDRLEADWSYVLTKGVGKTDAPDLLLVYDRPENHRGAGRTCFFSDGHAQWLTEAEFQKRMKAQEARLREPNRKRVE